MFTTNTSLSFLKLQLWEGEGGAENVMRLNNPVQLHPSALVIPVSFPFSGNNGRAVQWRPAGIHQDFSVRIEHGVLVCGHSDLTLVCVCVYCNCSSMKSSRQRFTYALSKAPSSVPAPDYPAANTAQLGATNQLSRNTHSLTKPLGEP